MIGSTIGRYRVSSKLGEGGMGSVWLAEDPMLGRSVALKILPERFADSPEAKDRLLQEARAASQLHHPGIATVYEAGEHEGRLYLAFEHVDGETVAQRVKREGPLPIDEAVRIAREAAAALGHAHASGILHRDVTSGNVMLDRTGAVKLVDFGLALPETQTRVTRPASAPGTLGYVAPEVVQGKPGDRRSDLYGLGVVLYETLTGHLPYERDRAEAVLYAVVHEEPEPPSKYREDLPPPLESSLLRLLAKDPPQRFPDSTELAAALVPSARAGGKKAASGRRRPRVILAVAALIAIAALVTWWRTRDVTARFESVAVLPLEISVQDAIENSHLAIGLGDALVTRLGRVSDLRISPWVSSRRYPPSELPLQTIGEELNVQSLVVGSFREESGRLRIELSLVDAATGATEWTQEFEDARNRLLELQDAISLALAHQMRGKLTAEEESALGRRPTDRADAYEQYLRGAAALQGTREGNEEARARFETALAMDPGLAEAHVGLGAALTERYWQSWGDPQDATIAVESFRRALNIDPEMYAALRGLIHTYWKLGRGEDCLRIALDVRERMSGSKGASVEALLTQAEGYLWGGLSEEAIPLLHVVNNLDPGNQAGHWMLTLAYANVGDASSTVTTGEEFLRSFGEDPHIHFMIAGAHRCAGNHEAARSHYERCLELFGDDVYPYVPASVAIAYLEMGDTTRAREVATKGIRQLEKRATERGSRLPDVIRLYAIVGDKTKVRQLEPTVRGGARDHVLFCAFALAQIGDAGGANDRLQEYAEAIRSRTNRLENGSASFDAFWLIEAECDVHLLFDTPVLRRLPAFTEVADAVREEMERRRSLYGR